MRNVLLALLLSAPLAAQTLDQVAQRTIVDPSLSSNISPAGTQVSLVSSEDDTVVRAQVGLEHGNWVTTLRAQAPLRKGADTTDLATLSGLSTGAVGTLQLTYFSMGRHLNRDAIFDACDAFNRTRPGPPQRLKMPDACTASTTFDDKGNEVRNDPLDRVLKVIAAWDTPEKEHLTAAARKAEREALRSACDDYNKSGAFPPIVPVETQCTDPATIRATMVAADADRAAKCTITKDHPKRDADADCWQQKLDDALTKQFKPLCESINGDPATWGQLAETGKSKCTYQELEKQDPIYGQLAIEKTHFSPFYLGVSGSVGNQAFKYALAPDFADTKITKYPFSVGATAGKLLLTTKTYVGLNASRERSFMGADTEQLCQPVKDSTATTCRDVALSAPTEQTKHIVQVEARQYLSDNIAINPRISRDFKNDVDAGEVLLYLFTSEKNGLNGGIDFGYKNDQTAKKTTRSVTLFIGTTFSLFSAP